jgi:hypothetical protein
MCGRLPRTETSSAARPSTTGPCSPWRQAASVVRNRRPLALRKAGTNGLGSLVSDAIAEKQPTTESSGPDPLGVGSAAQNHAVAGGGTRNRADDALQLRRGQRGPRRTRRCSDRRRGEPACGDRRLAARRARRRHRDVAGHPRPSGGDSPGADASYGLINGFEAADALISALDRANLADQDRLAGPLVAARIGSVTGAN